MSETPCFTMFSGGRPLNLRVKLSPPKFRGMGSQGKITDDSLVQIGKLDSNHFFIDFHDLEVFPPQLPFPAFHRVGLGNQNFVDTHT